MAALSSDAHYSEAENAMIARGQALVAEFLTNTNKEKVSKFLSRVCCKVRLQLGLKSGRSF